MNSPDIAPAPASVNETELSKPSPARVTTFHEAPRAKATVARAATTSAPVTVPYREFSMPVRGPSGRLGSDAAGTSGALAFANGEEETSAARHERWKKLGLQVVPVHIVDVTSQPIQGVRVTVDGIHMGQPGKPGAHGGWSENSYGLAPTDLTDEDGRADLASPVIITDLMEATGISFNAFKSGYSKRRVFNYPVDGTERDEALLKGNTLIVSAYIESPDQPAAEFTPTLSWSSEVQPSDWISLTDGRKQCDAIPDGKHILTAEYKAGDGATWLSDAIPFEVNGSESKEIAVKLKPPIKMRGRLSDNVPRPVTGGRVVACAQWPPPGSADTRSSVNSMRQASAVVAEDGTFEIAGLPEGPGEIIGVCDGFIASYREPGAKVYEQNQRYDLKAETAADPFILNMEPTGTLQVQVQDSKGQSIPGVTVNSWPNVFWSIGASQIYVDNEPGSKMWSAQSDSRGMARIKNLRAGKARYNVWGKGWAAPTHVDDQGRVDRTLFATITIGQVTNVTVTMEPAPANSPSYD